jgi:hypothetical protein
MTTANMDARRPKNCPRLADKQIADADARYKLVRVRVSNPVTSKNGALRVALDEPRKR